MCLVNVTLIALVQPLLLQLVCILKKGDKEEAQDSQDGHRHLTPDAVLTVDVPLSPLTVVLLRLIYASILIYDFICVYILDSRCVNIFIVELLAEGLGLFELCLELLLELLLDFLLEAEAGLPILLFDGLDDLLIFLLENLILNVALNIYLIHVKFEHGEARTDRTEADLAHHIVLLLHLLAGFLVGLGHLLAGLLVPLGLHLVLLLLLDKALYPVQLHLLLLNGVCELQHVGEVLKLDLAVQNDLRLPDQVLESLVTLHDLITAQRLRELLDSEV